MLNFSDVTCLAIAAILTFLLGLEREMKGREAGIRTHLIVGVASCLIMIVSKGIEPSNAARLAVGALTGMGFLGAGVVMKTKSHVKGLTTAAGLWSCSVIGLACGADYWLLAMLTTFIILVSNTILKNFFKFLKLI